MCATKKKRKEEERKEKYQRWSSARAHKAMARQLVRAMQTKIYTIKT